MVSKEDKLYVGRTVWIQTCGLAIQCIITEVNTEYRDKHPQGVIFYGVDEPIGWELSEDEIYLSKREALIALSDWQYEMQEFKRITLEEYRNNKIKWIARSKEQERYLRSLYRYKIQNVEWFN